MGNFLSLSATKLNLLRECEAKLLLAQAEEDPDRFTEREIEFLESIKTRTHLSLKQADILHQLWNKYER